MRRTLITGGAGFIGSHLATALLKRGHHVLCLDNFSTGSRENIQHILCHPHFELLCHDITFPFFGEVDEIYHLAPNRLHPVKSVNKIVNVAIEYSFDSDGKIAHIGHTYGPRMSSKQTLLPKLILHALKGQPITLNNEGNDSYSFCYIDDVVEGLILLMEGEDSSLHLEHPISHSLIHWSSLILALTHSNIPLKKEGHQLPRQKGAPWQPQVEIEVGLTKTIEYFKQQLHYTTQFI